MDPGIRGGLRRIGTDPFARSIALALGLIAGGFVGILLGWRGAARSVIVAEQLPFLFSGGLGGLALIVTGAGIVGVQTARYWSARERRSLDQVLRRRALIAQALTEETEISRVSAPPK